MGGNGPDDHHQRRHPDLLHASRDKSCLRDSSIDHILFFFKFWTKEQLVFNAFIGKNGYRTFQLSRELQRVMRYDREYKNSIWWHSGESEFESYSPLEREQQLIWKRYQNPGWFPFRDLN